jgi:hypothetical protein
MSNNSLFRKSSLDSISSPEQLNDYIKVANPSVWLVLGALFILLAVLFVWGFTGSLPTTVSAEGLVRDGNVLCYVSTEDADKINVSQTASITKSDDSELKGQVVNIDSVPMSAAEITSELGSDYFAQKLVQGEFAVKITVAPNGMDVPDGTLLNICIVTDSVRPIDFLLG